MIQALKPDSTSSAAGQAPSKESRTADPTFDPMLATLVAQMLGSFQQAPPQGAAPAAPRPESAPQRTEAPTASRAQEAMTSARTAGKAERRAPRGEEASAREARAPAERAERAQKERPEPKPAPEPTAEAAKEVPTQPDAPLPQALEANMGAALAAPNTQGTEAVAAAAAEEAAAAPEAPVAMAGGPRLVHAVTDERTPIVLDRPVETKAPVVVESLSQKAVPQGEMAVQALPTATEAAPEEAATPAPGRAVAAASSEAPKEATKTGPAPGDIGSTTPAAAESLPAPRPVTTPVVGRQTPEPKAPETAPVRPAASTSPATPVAAVAVTAVTSARESSPAQAQTAKAEPRIQAVGTLQAPVASTAPQRTQAFTAPQATTKATPHPVLTQVDGTIRWILRKQEQGAELQLHPESLGKVQIKLTVEGQQVHAQVWASEPSTLPILRENLAFLEVSLREQGLSLGNFQLRQGDRGQDAAFAQQQTHTSGLAGGLGVAESLQEVPLGVPTPLLGAYRIEVFA